MTKKRLNTGITIIFILIILLLILMIAVKIAGKDLPKTYNFPNAELSDSIFEQQNTQYIESSNLLYVYKFPKSPYKIDIYDSMSAQSGNITYISPADGFVMAFGDEKNDIIENSIIKGIGGIFISDYEQYQVETIPVVKQTGYLNGYDVEYSIIQTDYYLTNENTTSETSSTETVFQNFIMYYKANIPESKNAIEIAIATAEPSDQNFEIMKNALDEVFYTLRPANSSTEITDTDEEDTQAQYITNNKNIISKEEDLNNYEYQTEEASEEESKQEPSNEND